MHQTYLREYLALILLSSDNHHPGAGCNAKIIAVVPVGHECCILAVHIGIMFYRHISTATPGFISNAPIFYIPWFCLPFFARRSVIGLLPSGCVTILHPIANSCTVPLPTLTAEIGFCIQYLHTYSKIHLCRSCCLLLHFPTIHSAWMDVCLLDRYHLSNDKYRQNNRRASEAQVSLIFSMLRSHQAEHHLCLGFFYCYLPHKNHHKYNDPNARQNDHIYFY